MGMLKAPDFAGEGVIDRLFEGGVLRDIVGVPFVP